MTVLSKLKNDKDSEIDAVSADKSPVQFDCAVLGAGFSGLSAASVLQQNGLRVAIIEAADAPGGRLGGCEQVLDDGRIAVFDTSVSHFTAASPEFGTQLEEWAARALLRRHPTSYAGLGIYETRYSAPLGMHMFARALAHPLNIMYGRRLHGIQHIQGSLRLLTQAGETRGQAGDSTSEYLNARSVILTAPLPDCLESLGTDLNILPQLRSTLEQIDFQRNLTLLLSLDQASAPKNEWIIQPSSGPVNSISDNSAKGISPQAGALTIHAGSSWSNLFWDSHDEDIISTLTAVAADYIPGKVLHARLIRWDRSIPADSLEGSCLLLQDAPLIVCAGDVFGANVESAWLSGRAAAHKVMAQPAYV